MQLRSSGDVCYHVEYRDGGIGCYVPHAALTPVNVDADENYLMVGDSVKYIEDLFDISYKIRKFRQIRGKRSAFVYSESAKNGFWCETSLLRKVS